MHFKSYKLVYFDKILRVYIIFYPFICQLIHTSDVQIWKYGRLCTKWKVCTQSSCLILNIATFIKEKDLCMIIDRNRIIFFFGILEIEKLFSHIGRKTNEIPLPSLLILKFLVFWRFNSIYECVTHIGWIFNEYLSFLRKDNMKHRKRKRSF